MQRWFAVVLCLVVAVPLIAAKVGDMPPNFRLPGANGKKIALEDYRGQVVLVNFWASWCAPCRKELPELDKLYQENRDKGFTVIGVNIDKERKNADKFLNKFSVSFPVGYDPESKIISAYKGQAMPTSYLIGRDGKVKKVFLGFTMKKLPKMRQHIIATIAESRGG